MSISHTLDIATMMTKEQLSKFLLEGFDLHLAPHGRFDGLGVGVSIRDLDLEWKQLIQKEHHVAVNRHLSFRMDFSESLDNGELLMARVAAALLSREPGDAVLLHNGETPMVKRINGDLVAYEGWSESVTPALDARGVRYVKRKPSDD